MTQLTDADAQTIQTAMKTYDYDPLFAAVEQIKRDAVNEALAPIEALADKWAGTNFAAIWRDGEELRAAIRDGRGDDDQPHVQEPPC